jgi:hypothetical protein
MTLCTLVRAGVLAVLGTSAACLAQVSIVLTAHKDNTLYQDTAGGLSNGAGTRFFCGVTNTARLRRGLLAFDVAARLPRCATVVAVEVVLTVRMTRSGSELIGLHRVDQAWGEAGSVAGSGQGGGGVAQSGDVTWVHTHHPANLWLVVGGDFDATASSSAAVGGLGAYTWPSTPRLVADVQAWLDHPEQNHGWLVRATERGFGTAKAFATREDPTPADRPQLRIVYLPPPASVTRVGNGCRGSGATPLSLDPVGLPTLPSAFALVLGGGGPGPHVLVWAAGTSSTPLPLGGGCDLWLELSTIFASYSTPQRTFPLPLPANPALIGAKLAAQAVVLDTALPALTLSNALRIVVGV